MNDTGTPADGSVSVSPISDNAQRIIEKRYSRKDANGKPLETWSDITRRVILFVSGAETDPAKGAEFYAQMRALMMARKFLPNTPCLVNAGVNGGGLAGCYVLPVPDSIKGIMKAASDAAVIHQGGGGTGFSFETLRPANSVVKSTHGIASGPISFMGIFDKVTDVVKQGGVRRGANMGIMRCDHPDILRFIHAKNDQHSLTNFNISVTVTDEFMKAVESNGFIQTKFQGEPWLQPVFDPLDPDGENTNDVYGNSYDAYKSGQLYAPAVWRRIVESAHEFAEPGIIFIDTINRHNLLRASMGDIIATNPCAEQALHPYNSCNLGSIDVAKFYKPNWNGANAERDAKGWQPEGDFDWDAFADAVYWSVRFLDNVIDVGEWAIPEIADVVKRTRPVGLGIMGFADLLLKLKLAYGSEESMNFLNTLTYHLQREGWEASCRIGKEKGAFPEYEKNKEAYDNFLWNTMELDDATLYSLENVDEIVRDGHAAHFQPRNYEVTTIAPTGTISLVAETSSGIEPNFAWEHTRKDTVGVRSYVHPLAAQARQENGGKLPDYFVTANDLTAIQHVQMLAAAQRNIDNGVSKTCNAHADDTVQSVDDLYRRAHRLGVKAVSYYRDGSREGQVLTQAVEKKEDKCPQCGAELTHKEGCTSCSAECGFAACTIG